MGHQHFLLVTRASDEANPCSTPSLLKHVVVPPLLRSRHPLSESPQSIAWHRIKTNWVCQNRIKNSCSLFPQNTPSLLQKQVLSCLLCLQSVTVARPGRQNSQLPIQEAVGRAVSPEDSSKNPTGAISKETQRRLVSVTEGKILQPCLRSCSRSSQLSFVQCRELLHAPKPESKNSRRSSLGPVPCGRAGTYGSWFYHSACKDGGCGKQNFPSSHVVL